MKEVIIREATLTDLESLLICEQGVITAERPFDSTMKAEPLHYYDIPYMIEADHIHLLVAELDSQIIGCGYARIEEARKPYLKHTQHGYLGFMYTAPGYRGKGVNRKIIEALKLWCKQKKITELILDVYEDNVAAIKAYEKVGFAKHLVEMRLGIE